MARQKEEEYNGNKRARKRTLVFGEYVCRGKGEKGIECRGPDPSRNLRTIPDVSRDACLLARMMATNMYFSQIKVLMFEMSM
nr:phosphoenolpyruvate carboxylase gene [Tanacetum cinerariifolium]